MGWQQWRSISDIWLINAWRGSKGRSRREWEGTRRGDDSSPVIRSQSQQFLRRSPSRGPSSPQAAAQRASGRPWVYQVQVDPLLPLPMRQASHSPAVSLCPPRVQGELGLQTPPEQFQRCCIWKRQEVGGMRRGGARKEGLETEGGLVAFEPCTAFLGRSGHRSPCSSIEGLAVIVPVELSAVPLCEQDQYQ